MNILYGLATPDEGEILLDGERGQPDRSVRRHRPRHQHGPPALHARAGADRRREHRARRGDDGRGRSSSTARRRTAGSSSSAGGSASRSTPTPRSARCRSAGSSASRSSRRSTATRRILVLDEPTAVLTPQETEEIFEVLRRLAAEGHSIVFISHKLYEVLEIADRITVIRRGKVVGERIPSETNEEDLAELMVGREVSLIVDRGESHPAGADAPGRGPDRSTDDRGHEVVHGVDLEVRAGEILGIAGVAGNGQDELVEAIVGLRKPTAGRVDARRAWTSPAQGPRDVYAAGVAYVPADRHRFGLVLSFTHRRQPRPDQLPPAAVRARHPAQRRRDRADGRGADRGVRHPHAVGRRQGRRRCPAATSRRSSSRASSTRDLQAARARPADPRPRRRQHRVHPPAGRSPSATPGRPILLVSAELDEVLELSDRIAVIYRGKLVGDPRRPDGRQERGRPADGDRRSRGGRRRPTPTASRRRDSDGVPLTPRLAHPRPAAHLDRPVGRSSARWSSSLSEWLVTGRARAGPGASMPTPR